MKILFAIQGTGNGHLSRARDIYPELAKHGEVDVLISGIQADVEVPFPVKYRLYGMSFIFGRHGGVDIRQTAKKLRLARLINNIRKLPVQEYDLVVNDFEPVSAWASRLKRKPCIALSHQSAVLHPEAPAPERADLMGLLILRHYAPVTAAYGFHFKSYSTDIYTPVIRKEIRTLTPVNKGHYTIYLPAYDYQTLLEHLSRFPNTSWQVFSKHNKDAYTRSNISIQPIENDAFIKSIESCEGVLCGAGFEGPAEALYLGKKLMVIPMQAQYEQHCNAAALRNMGIPVIKQLSSKYYAQLNWWIAAGEPIQVSYPDQTAQIVAMLVEKNSRAYSLRMAGA